MIDLDDALERLHHCGFEYGMGFANHGPMAAEALVELGHPALLVGWTDLYPPRLPEIERGRALAASELEAARGDITRLPDWVVSFEERVEARPWRECLRAELPPLLPGLFAAAAHGMLRVAHAVRALERGETATRRRELAHGLAYWAARYEELPGEPGSRARCGPDTAFEALPVVPLAERKGGLFTDAVASLGDLAGFCDAIEAFDPRAVAPEAWLTSLCRFAAGRYLENPGARIAYVHTLTAPSALRLLLPFLEEADARRALGYAFQTVVALHAVSAGAPEDPADSSGAWGKPPPTRDEIERVAGDEAELRYRAACSLEEHAIKFTAACLVEDALAPDPVFRLAAADAALTLEGRGVGG